MASLRPMSATKLHRTVILPCSGAACCANSRQRAARVILKTGAVCRASGSLRFRFPRTANSCFTQRSVATSRDMSPQLSDQFSFIRLAVGPVVCFLVLALAMPRSAPAATPQILEIARDFLKPGHDAEYRAIEIDARNICARLGFPHHYLAIESLTGEKEVWFLNAFASQAELQQLAEDYNKNTELLAALNHFTERKKGIVTTTLEHFANYRPDLTRGAPWNMGHGRFLVIAVTNSNAEAAAPSSPANFDATVFQAGDGTRYLFSQAQTREQADALAAAVPGARIFAVRPYWGLPDPEWISADPQFWQSRKQP